MATFDSGRQRYSMNFYASHQRPLQRRSYTGRPSRPAEGQLRATGGSRREANRCHTTVEGEHRPRLGARGLMTTCSSPRRAYSGKRSLASIK